MTSKNSSDLWNESLKLVSYCPVCEARYNSIEARILGKNGETHLLHIVCRKCCNSILSLVLVNQVGASSVGLMTDLTFDDVMKFRTGSSVSIDDVIEAHALFEGDWQKKFNVQKSTSRVACLKSTPNAKK